MRFVPIEKAKIKINDSVFLQFEDGTFGYGKLIERKETAEGMQHTFKVGDPNGEAFDCIHVKYIAVPKFAE